MKIIAVTGTPGTGKTFLAQKLSLLLDYAYLNLNELAKKRRIFGYYDAKRRTYAVDPKKMASEALKVSQTLASEGSKGILMDSHLSHFLSPKNVNLCVVVKCSLKELKRRLEARGYNKEKVRENLDSEIFDTCYTEALELGHKVLVVDGTHLDDKGIAAIAKKMAKELP